MEELGLIRDLAVVWSAAVLAGALFVRLKLPLIAAYILAGIILGPSGAKLISEPKEIHVLAEFGVALLLFALGVEISLKRVFTSATKALLAGVCQIVFTVALIVAYAYTAGISPNIGSGLLFGLVCALSSTAVVTKLLVDRGETETLHARVLIPILLIQDLSLIPVVALLPALQESGTAIAWTMATALFKAIALMVFVFAGSTLIVPRILGWVARTDSRELFTLTALALCLTVAFLSRALGVSLSLGAFLGGIMISERPYGHQVLADLVPIRDLFASVFFVSIGLLLNPNFIAEHLLEVVTFVVVLIVGKTLAAGASAYIATRSLWSAGLVGVNLAQIGEFSFVLAMIGYQAKLLPESLYNLFFAGAVVSLIISPALIAGAPKLFGKIPRFRMHRLMESRAHVSPARQMHSHLVLCGYGRIGRHLGFVLDSYKIPFVVVDVSGGVIDELREKNIPHVYGDAFSHVVLENTNIAEASCLVVTVPDPIVAMHIITIAKQKNPNIRVVARAHHTHDIELFRAAGANAVVQPEFEASVEITKMALLGMERSGVEVRAALKDIRRRGYMMFKPELLTDEFVEFPHDDYFGIWFTYDGDEATLQSLDARKKTGATVLAVKRQEGVFPHPDGSWPLTTGDTLYVAGSEHQLAAFEETLPVRRLCLTSEATSDEIRTTGGELAS